MRKFFICLLRVSGAFIITAALNLHANAQAVRTSVTEKNGSGLFKLSNENIVVKVVILDGKLIADTLSGDPSWLQSFGSGPSAWSQTGTSGCSSCGPTGRPRKS
jgi:hypothetical protein